MAYLGRQPNTGVRSRYIYTATASQTTFSGSDDDGKTLKYEDAAYLDVFLNGVLLKPVTDYAATTKTSVVLTSGAAVSDIVEIVAYDIANIADTVSKANGGTFDAGVTVNGDLTVDTNTLYVDSVNNKVGIGTTAPNNYYAKDLVIAAPDEGGITVVSDPTHSAYLLFADGTSGADQYRGQIFYDHNVDRLGIATNGSTRLLIDSSGNLLVGKTAPDQAVEGMEFAASNYLLCTKSGGTTAYFNRTTSNGTIVEFRKDGTTVGSISVTASATSYNTSSDYRLKENVADLTGAIDRVKQVPVHRFNFKATPENTVDGFLAHEVQSIVPEAVTGTKDAMKTEEYEVTPAVLDDDGNVVTEAVMGTREVPDYQGIDQSKLVPLLTAAIKEQQALIEDLQTRLAALENA